VWGRMASGGRVSLGPRVGSTLPRIAASRKRYWRFSAGVAGASKGGRRIVNPPQVHTLPRIAAKPQQVLAILRGRVQGRQAD
jgi:hypothetical protein